MIAKRRCPIAGSSIVPSTYSANALNIRCREPGVEEAGREQPPDLAVGDRRPRDRAVVDQLRAAELRPGRVRATRHRAELDEDDDARAARR